MFNIRDFSATISDHSPIHLNKFMVYITPPNGLSSEIVDDLNMLCDTTNLPGVSFGSDDVRHKGYGIAEKRPTTIGFEDITLTIIGDGKGKVKDFLHKWFNQVMPFDIEDESASELFNYPEEYIGTIEIITFDQAGNPVTKYTMNRCWPIGLGSIQMGWEQVDSLMRIPVTFTYKSFKKNTLNLGASSSIQYPSIDAYAQRINS